MKSDEKARVGEADDPLALRLSLSFTCGAEGRLHSARRLGPSSVRRAPSGLQKARLSTTLRNKKWAPVRGAEGALMFSSTRGVGYA